MTPRTTTLVALLTATVLAVPAFALPAARPLVGALTDSLPVDRAAADGSATADRAVPPAASSSEAVATAAALRSTSRSSQVRASKVRRLTRKQVRRIARRVRTEPRPARIRRVPGEPGTVAGWRAMFHRLPTDEWGGGDVSVSVRLASGRRLWIYGDTLSRRNGFVHSSAIVTSGRRIRVANQGRQVLPVGAVRKGRKTVHWTETLTPLRGEDVLVTTTPISISARGGDMWDFHRVREQSRQGVLRVDARGDVRFLGWVGWVPRPDIGTDGEDFASPGPGEWTYGAYVHPIRLADGRFLRTRNRNYSEPMPRNGDGSLQLRKWRPTFEASSTRTRPYWGR